MRKKNSLFDQVCNFINTIPVGQTFTNEQLYSNTNEYMSDYKMKYCKGDRQTTRYYRYHLIHAGAVKRVSKGVWQVLSHIPDFVTLSMVEQDKYVRGKNGRNLKKNNNRWNAKFEIKEKEMSQEEITIFEITKNNLVLPITVVKTRVPSLMATGSYFENETDAAYFLSVGTGIPVELILKNSKEFIEGSDNENWENEIIERLDSLLVIEDKIGNAKPWKWIYRFNFDDETVIKRKAHIDEVALESADENESLKKLLQVTGGSVRLWTEIADELIEKLSIPKPNETLKLAGDSYKRRINLDHKQEPGKTYQIFERKDETFEQSLLMEDIRGKEVYFFDKSLMVKGEVLCFIIGVPAKPGNPFYSDITVKGQNGETYYFKNQSELSFSKEAFIKRLTEAVNSL